KQASATVKQFAGDAENAFKRIRDAGTGMGTGIAATSEKLDTMMQRSAQNVRPLEEAFKRVGTSYQQQVDHVKTGNLGGTIAQDAAKGQSALGTLREELSAAGTAFVAGRS